MASVEPRRWSREEYHRMAEAGILAPDERVELIDGEVVRVTPQGGRHARGIRAAEEALRAVLRDGFDVRVQLPLALDPSSEPEPDISVVRGSWRDYDADHPETAALVVEIAHSSLSFDAGVKASLYARDGIAEYWIVNVAARRVEVRRDPVRSETAPLGWAYREVRHAGPGERIAPLAAPGAEVAVDDLLA